MVRAKTAWMAAVLLGILPTASLRAEDDPPPPPRFETLDNDLAWQRLDPAQPMLPVWARTLVRSLPRTTAAMLDLDSLHRSNNPLGTVLAGKLRWIVADAMRCHYFRSMAEQDLRRSGLSDTDIAALRTLAETQPPNRDLAALRFARQLTIAGHEVTDEQVGQLVEQVGAEQVVAIVHTIAFANFQNRIVLALGLAEEQGIVEPPLAPRWDRQRLAKLSTLPRQIPSETSHLLQLDDDLPLPRWSMERALDVESRLEEQKYKRLRIPLPDATRIAALPPEARAQAEKVLWDRVSSGYQPAMTAGWFACLRPFKDESQMDRVFANSLFWVVTRENQCFY